MKKTIVAVSTVAILGFTGTFLTETAHAEKTVDEIQDERSEVKENLSDAEAEIADILLDLKDLNNEIDRVDKALKENKEQVKKTEDKIAGKEKKVDELQDEIKGLEKKIEKRYEIMKERIISYQKSGGDIKYLEVLFDSSSFSDFINRTSAVSKISDADKDLMKRQEEAKKEVEAKQEKVQEKIDELEDEKAEKKAIKDTIKEQKKQNEAKKEKLKAKQTELEDRKAELEIKDSDLADLEADIQESMKVSDSGNDNDNDNEDEDESAIKTTVDNSSDVSESNSSSTTATNNSSTIKSGSLNTTKDTSNNATKKHNTKPKAVKTNTNSGGGSALTAGEKYIGNSTYVFGGGRTQSDIENGYFDCSGFVSWSYSQEGVSLPASTGGLANSGKKVSYSEAQPGDLVFFDTYKKNGHVGIYLGNGQFIGSQDSTGVAKVDMSNPYWSKHFHGHVRRVK